MSRNQKQLDSFTKYCLDHPEQRFWEALRNWNQIKNPIENFILVGELSDIDTNDDMWDNIEDTYFRD